MASPFKPAVRENVCSVDGCASAIYCKGMCALHYKRLWYSGDVHAGDFDRKFESKIDKRGDCWIWTGALFVSGYGKIQRGGKRLRAHRVSYELFVGEIPDGLHVLHDCDNPPCVKPAHLFLGTHLDNMMDMERKGRAKWIQENLRRAA